MSAASNMLSRYLEGDSFLHRWDSRVKLAVALGFILALASLPAGSWVAFGAMISLVWTGAAFSQLGMVRIFRRSLLAVPFILIALPVVFTRPGVALADLDLGLFHLTVQDGGLIFFASVMLKSWASVTAAALLTATTPPVELLQALRALRVPAILVIIAGLMYGYLFVLTEQAQQLMRARRARSAALTRKSGGGIPWRARVVGGMAGSLFIRTLDRSERIYLAMVSRGYDGRVIQTQGVNLGGWAIAQVSLLLFLFTTIAVLGRVAW